MTKFDNLPGKWTLILTRPNGGVVGAFGDPWARCPEEFPRVHVYSHPPESVLPPDQVQKILQANGMDPTVYERARDLLRQAARGDAAAVPPEPCESVPVEAAKALNDVPAMPAAIATPIHVEPMCMEEGVTPLDPLGATKVDSSKAEKHVRSPQGYLTLHAPVQTALF